MDLLIIKTRDQYIRFKDNDYLKVGLDKASVFPMDRLETVRDHIHELKTRGIDAVIKRLRLTEEDFEA